MNNFAQAMEAIPAAKVTGMLLRMNNALKKREAFERDKAPHSALIEFNAAKVQMTGNKTVARFLCVMGADPDLMLNRERKAGYRANLKAIRKIRMLAEYCSGEHSKLNGVCKALFAATILADVINSPWVSNNDAERILLRLPLDGMNPELKEALEELRGLNIRDAKEARNQACQFRTAFENLGCYRSSRDDQNNLSSNGIRAIMSNPLMAYLSFRWGIN